MACPLPVKVDKALSATPFHYGVPGVTYSTVILNPSLSAWFPSAWFSLELSRQNVLNNQLVTLAQHLDPF